MTTIVKWSRAKFALVIAIINATMVYLVPLIPVPPLQGFAVAVINGIIIYLATEEQQLPQPSAPAQ